MIVLIIGNGGREHALAWKVAQSEKVSKVYVAPGNAGTAQEHKVQNVSIAPDDIDSLLAFAHKEQINLTIVGPEAPLVLGITDRFQQLGLKCFGPSKAASQLEGSKQFCKDFLERHNIPTAAYQTFTDSNTALDYVQSRDLPIVIKADGLAAGKGVIIAHSLSEAENAIRSFLDDNKFGDAGNRIVIEDFLQGEEASFMVMVDGRNALPFASSQDHKAALDGDLGPNTGGMGAYSPAPVIDENLHEQIMQEIIYPTIQAMADEGNSYTGFLYAGLMIDSNGKANVLEYNCRLGDPETQPILMRLESDLVDLCLKAFEQGLDQCQASWNSKTALGVVMAAGGYPGNYTTGTTIHGLKQVDDNLNQAKLFHAGTALRGKKVVTAGGRVLCATAIGNTVTEAQKNAYKLATQINWDGVYYRKDIGYRAVKRELGSVDN